LPFGEKEAFLGNAGIALEDSSGAVFYNPGSLGFVNDKKISVYGNAYTFNRYSTRQSIGVDQPDLLTNSNSSSSVPLSSVTIFGVGNWTYGFSVNTPYNSRSETSLPYQSQTIEIKVSQDASENSLWLGPTMARKVSEDIAVGASLFLARYSQSINSITYVKEIATNTVSTGGLRVSASDWSALLILGAQWRINSRWTTGLRIQSASADIRGRSDYFTTSQKNGISPSATMQAENGIYSRFRRPFNFGLGTKFAPLPQLNLLADVNAQLPIHYDEIPSRPAVNSRTETKFTARSNLGAIWDISKEHSLLLGFLYNPSTIAKNMPATSGKVHENFKGLSLGLQKDMGKLISSLGGFYLWSSLAQPLANTTTNSSYSHQVFGMLLTASYKL
jgi:long-subunit fatty acid transport protein